MQQLATLNEAYEGGLVAYITNAKKLLADSKQGWQRPLAALPLFEHNRLSILACRQERL